MYLTKFEDLSQSRDVSSTQATVRRIHRVAKEQQQQFSSALNKHSTSIKSKILKLTKTNIDRKLFKLFDPALKQHKLTSPYKPASMCVTNDKGKYTGDFMLSFPSLSRVLRMGDYRQNDCNMDNVKSHAISVSNIGVTRWVGTGYIQVGCSMSSMVTFSNHSLERFLQRAKLNSVFDLFAAISEANSNAEMLVNSIGQYVTIPVDQGIFFGEQMDNELIIKTFVDTGRLYDNQIRLANIIASRLDGVRVQYEAMKNGHWMKSSINLRRKLEEDFDASSVPESLRVSTISRLVAINITKACVNTCGLEYNEDDFAIFDPKEAVRDYEERLVS